MPDGRNRTAEVEVTSHAGGVCLALEHDAARMDAMLLPEDVDRVIGELAAAKDRLDGREVEEVREWVDADYTPE